MGERLKAKDFLDFKKLVNERSAKINEAVVEELDVHDLLVDAYKFFQDYIQKILAQIGLGTKPAISEQAFTQGTGH